LTLRLLAAFDDGTLKATVADRVFKAGGREMELGEVQDIRLGPTPRVVLHDGKTVEGMVSGLDAVPVRLGGQTLSVNLARATDVKVTPTAETARVGCTLLVRQGDKEVFRQSESLIIQGILEGLVGVTFVSDLEWTKATAGDRNMVHRDRNVHGNKLRINGRTYAKGFWTHSFNDATPADVVIDIGGKNYTLFAANVGIDDACDAGSVEFQVLVDGQLKAKSPVMLHRAVHAFHVPVKDAKEVTLRVLNGGDGYSSDWAVWGWARFIVAGAGDPLEE
jgi:hypothetical protein